ncbi:Na+/H+ antiporter NhaA [Pimelobacter simplex]|uniref:Na+/H+ antiporter NhaA n=1 Tax=Nocardioides simplex TaxID=2045 RepID=UPI00214F824F|nr:Na+/H+ antiporter NhaA [Pimelobacter simplex]UUW90685.1 Na+/H+ antiporter NhaA [Pimelobacter simplex]UUW94514.1 Na+/H+ antiporter NhaA [Pimelobacter simplex]
MPATPPPSDDLWRQGPVWTASDKPLAKYVGRPVREFLRIESAGSVLLLTATIAALLWVNLPFHGWAEGYDRFWHTPIALEIGSWRIEESLQHWVNDGLMTIFFFVVGLEIKHEMVHGDLRDPRTAALPIVAAVGGMVVPALVYVVIAGGPETGAGWGIPMATDIAFAVGVLGLLGRRVPSAARLFLLTLAIVDDIGAILVIAVFYTADVSFVWLAVAVALIALMAVLRALRVWAVPVYVVIGVGAWFALLESGVHATLAGVAIGLLTPAGALLRPEVATDYAVDGLRDNELDADELRRLRFLIGESVPMVERLQTRLHPLSAYVVLPVFALANAGVALGGGVLGDALTSTVGLGIGAGLVLGKPLGIALACFVAVRLGIARMPEGTGWLQVIGVGAVAGIGFTVSLFIAGLSFPGSPVLTDDAKVGILVASMVAAVVGVGLLLLAGRGRPAAAEVSPAAPEPSRAPAPR